MNNEVSQKNAILLRPRFTATAEESLLIALLNDIKRDTIKMRQTGQEVAKRYGKR